MLGFAPLPSQLVAVGEERASLVGGGVHAQRRATTLPDSLRTHLCPGGSANSPSPVAPFPHDVVLRVAPVRRCTVPSSNPFAPLVPRSPRRIPPNPVDLRGAAVRGYFGITEGHGQNEAERRSVRGETYGRDGERRGELPVMQKSNLMHLLRTRSTF